VITVVALTCVPVAVGDWVMVGVTRVAVLDTPSRVVDVWEVSAEDAHPVRTSVTTAYIKATRTTSVIRLIVFSSVLNAVTPTLLPVC
jgi:hypothetical protein